MDKFELKPSLKNHYLMEEPLNDLLDCFRMVFEAEKKELIRKHIKGFDNLSFSPTVFAISDMIVHKYFNTELSFAQRAFITCTKFRGYPFQTKIKELQIN